MSNQLTLARIFLIPLFVLFFYLPGTWGYLLGCLVFSAAAITDWLDGYYARTRNEETPFGRFLDPVADKLLVATALVLLAEADRAPAVLAAIIIGREITIGALREWMAQMASVVHVTAVGKWKTGVQMAAIICLLFNMNFLGLDLHLIGTLLLWIASVLTLWSAYTYLKAAWPYIGDRSPERPTAEVDEWHLP